MLINKKKITWQLVDFTVPADPRMKIKEKKIFGSYQKAEKFLEDKGDGDINCS